MTQTRVHFITDSGLSISLLLAVVMSIDFFNDVIWM